MSLFRDDEGPSARPAASRTAPPGPLADRMRPRALDQVVGQERLLGSGRALRLAIEAAAETGALPSMIFWGPPGSGKTTLARLVAEASGARFQPFSAVTSGIREIREVIADASRELKACGRRTVLFIDEIHRFNKAQQDAFLPHVEEGTIVLIGATTENPSFEVNAALLSRLTVLVLDPLAPADIRTLLGRAASDAERGLGRYRPVLSPEASEFLAERSDGDARRALNALESAVLSKKPGPGGERAIGLKEAQEALQRRPLRYDRAGEEHYNLISALHKSIRDSDPDAALYWLARMLAGGEDPLFLARRLVRAASEDVGNADPAALRIALDARDAYDFLGTPEGELALAQAALYLACAPKSNACYRAWGAAREDAERFGSEPVPLVIRNAPTRLLKDLGYGRGYRYAHDAADAVVDQDHLPDRLRGRRYYEPTDRGFEEEIRARLDRWRRIREGRP